MSKSLNNQPAALVVLDVRTNFACQLRISKAVDVIILQCIRLSKYTDKVTTALCTSSE